MPACSPRSTWSPDGNRIATDAGGLGAPGDGEGFAYLPGTHMAFRADASGRLRANTEAMIFLRAFCVRESCDESDEADLLDDLVLTSWLPRAVQV